MDGGPSILLSLPLNELTRKVEIKQHLIVWTFLNDLHYAIYPIKGKTNKTKLNKQKKKSKQ